MPRKINYGIDYDYADYGAYDDDAYDYCDYEEEISQAPEGLDMNNKAIQSSIWRCSICTYDNDESMSACDICGVIRSPVVHNTSSSNQRTAPFKFDVPSPDDLVSNGIWSSRTVSKANSLLDFSSSIATKDSAHKVTPGLKKLDLSLMPKGNDDDDVDRHPVSANKPENPSTSAKKKDDSSISISTEIYNGVEETHGFLATVDTPENLTSSFNSMSVNVKSDSKIPGTWEQYKPEKWMLPVQSEDGLTQLNLAIVGHIDSGKSTLSGRLLHLLGQISQKEMHKYEKEAKLQGKGSFSYAWALDESAEERERGITMAVAIAYFDSKNYHVVVLDSPGHKDFIPNMISGATQADAAVLVIDASYGSFEAGMDRTEGQTKEHAQLVRRFGVDQIIVAINKMDVIQYSEERFNSIKVQVGSFLRSCGFKDSSVLWIPLSVMENQNLVVPASDVRLLSWYHGPYLLDAIDSLQPPARDFSRPLIMPICDVIKSRSLGQVSACGKLVAGALRSGVKVLVLPSGDVGTVRSIERDSQPCSIARAGDNVAVTLQSVDGAFMMAGDVICHPEFPVAVADHLELKIRILEASVPILIGSQLEFFIHHAKEAASVVRIVSLLDSKTGEVTKKAPRCLMSKQSAVVEVVLQKAVCVEEFSNCRALGRAFLRASGRTVAVGVVNRVIQH